MYIFFLFYNLNILHIRFHILISLYFSTNDSTILVIMIVIIISFLSIIIPPNASEVFE